MVLCTVAVATMIGLIALWPHGGRATVSSDAAQFAAKGTTFPNAEIVSITPQCPDLGEPSSSQPDTETSACELAEVRILSGRRANTTATVELQGPFAGAGLRPGDTLELMVSPPVAGIDSSDTGGVDPEVSVFGIVRTAPLALWVGLFVLVVAAVGLLRGVLALVGLAFSGLMIVAFILPALLGGGSGMAVALTGASAILYVVLYLAHGLSLRTSAALAGTLAGVLITALIAQLAVGTSRLSGIGDEEASFLAGMTSHMNFQGLLTCAIIIAGLGVLNDVTITQSSSVWELRAAAPHLPRRHIFTRAMRIGRDHIASTIYTIVFAYAGASLSVLLLLYIYNRPLLSLLSYEDIATEIIRTLCSGIGLVLAVPITTAIAALLLPADTPRENREGEQDALADVPPESTSTAEWLRALKAPPDAAEEAPASPTTARVTPSSPG
ncbi:YibE/F family protein [Microbacterium horticulturae]|uniref:YibE/F family protein n=1 Tax=Microbacterium horticulturae TaxID=3028316 RepID=A0ABY8BWY0_9MICO|nr:YibE/F family protein [Microbacterium sp. KACC 23027]WEG08659.1 YibE/F family protein [Microbacterium sp. KACC 23027]